MNRVKYLLSIVIVAVLITTGSSLKCYNCISNMNKECLDPSEHSNLKPQECSPELLRNLSNQVKQYAQSFGATIGLDIDKNTEHLTANLVCQKIVSTVNNEKVIIRGCQIKGTDTFDSCKAVVDKQPSGTISHCSTCDGDGCNSGHWMAPLSLSAILIPALCVIVRPLLF